MKKNTTFNPSNANLTKWSNTPKRLLPMSWVYFTILWGRRWKGQGFTEGLFLLSSHIFLDYDFE